MNKLHKLLFSLVLLGVISGFQTSPVSASTTDFWGFKVETWQKYPQPVLPARAGMWDSGRTREMSVVVNDTDGTQYRGTGGQLTAYYFGSDLPSETDTFQVGRTTSADNGYTWGDRTIGLAPSGVTGSWYATDVYSPSVIRQVSDGKLLMMAVGQNGGPNTEVIGALTSTDNGTTWTDQGVQVTMSMFHKEDSTPITEFGVPRVIKRTGGDYLMVLEGQVYGSSQWRIFAATSSSFTGGSWTAVNGGNPILTPSSATWENVGVANPQIMEIAPSSYVMAYNGRGTGGPGCWQVGFASSTDLVTWYRNPGNPVLTTSTNGFDNFCIETSGLVKADSYGVAKLYTQGYNTTTQLPQIGVATADWNEFSQLFVGSDGKQYGRRVDGALLRITVPAGGNTPWEQIGSGWNQFTTIFSDKSNGRIYAIRGGDGALMWNQYSGSGWVGWTQIGSGWQGFAKVFLGTDGYFYAIQTDGSLLRNSFNGSSWSGWVQIGSGWQQFTQVFMGTDGWIYAVRSDGVLLKNHYTTGWSGWVEIGNGWQQFTEVYPGLNNMIYARRSDGHLFRNKYVDSSGWIGWEEL